MSNAASMIILVGGCSFIALIWWVIVEVSIGKAPKWKIPIRVLGLVVCVLMAFMFGYMIAPLLK